MGKSEVARDLESLLEYVRDNRGFDFTGYKRASLDRRIRKRMADARIRSWPPYRDYLEAHPEEFALLFNTILMNVTAFFRDPAAWDFLTRKSSRRSWRPASRRRVRAWSAGCASGEEPYTLAIRGRGAGRGGIPPPRQNLRHGHGPGSAPRGAARDLRRQGRRRGPAEAAREIVQAGGRFLRLTERHAQLGHLRPARRVSRRAHLAPGPDPLPQHADVFQHRGAGARAGAVPLRAEGQRLSSSWAARRRCWRRTSFSRR